MSIRKVLVFAGVFISFACIVVLLVAWQGDPPPAGRNVRFLVQDINTGKQYMSRWGYNTSNQNGLIYSLELAADGVYRIGDGSYGLLEVYFADGTGSSLKGLRWGDSVFAILNDGTNFRVTAPAGANFSPETAAGMNLGDGTRYWNDVSYKTLTDRGCLGFFDIGVELRDGRIVSDIEALESIKPHPTKLTVYGVPMLDYSSMPKVVYKPAPDKAPNGNVWQVDEQGRKYYQFKQADGSLSERLYYEDGAEMSALVSIMLGAIKELNNKVESLESQLKEDGR